MIRRIGRMVEVKMDGLTYIWVVTIGTIVALVGVGVGVLVFGPK